MAKKWSEVIQSEAYISLPDEEKEQARNQYFNDVVAPKVKSSDLTSVRKQFDADTSIVPKKTTGITGSWSENPITDMSGTGEEISPQKTELSKRLSKRWENIGSTAERGFAGDITSDIAKAPGVAAIGATQTIGAGLDILGTGVGKALSTITPDIVKQYGKEKLNAILNTDLGKKGLSALETGIGTWNEFKREYPDAALSLEGIFNIAALGVTEKGAEKSLKGIQKASEIQNRISAANIEKKLTKTVTEGISKGVKPSVAKKGTYGQIQSYYKKAKEGVVSIIENKKNLKLSDEYGFEFNGLPETRMQFSQAIQQTERNIFDQYDALAKQTVGDVINPEPIAKELESFASDRIVKKYAPEASNHALNLAEKIREDGMISASQAQKEIAHLNGKLNAYYSNPSPTEYAKANVDALVANMLRKQTDDAITSATGAEYQVLKNKYGSLKAIEQDAAKAAIRGAKQDIKGLIDFTDIFSGAQAANAIATGNIGLLASATGAKSVAKWYKWINNPDKKIRKMFEKAEILYHSR